MDKKYGFTLIELMVVVAIIALLSLIAIPRYWRFQAEAKRAEVYLNLGSLHTAEKLYWSEHGTYSDKLLGEDGIGWMVDGEPNYTYGFAGSANVNYVQGKLGQDVGELAKHAQAGKNNFTAVAIADIDGDGKLDVMTIDENKKIKIIQNDLAD